MDVAFTGCNLATLCLIKFNFIILLKALLEMARFAHTGMSWGKARLSSRGPFTFTHSIELPKVALGRRQVREKGWHSSQGGRRAGVKREGKERTGVSPRSVPGLLT